MKLTTFAKLVGGAALITATVGAGVAIHQQPSKADTTTTGNTWYYNMTDPNKDGMELKGVQGSLKQIFEVKDPYGAPIFSVGHVGGANVYGDMLRVFAGNDIFDPTAIIHPDGSIEITSYASNPVVNIQGVYLTKADINWIHSQRGCVNGSTC